MSRTSWRAFFCTCYKIVEKMRGEESINRILRCTHNGLPYAWPVDTNKEQVYWQWYRDQPKRR